MDILVNKTKSNYQKLENAFHDFGMPMFDMTEENFLNNKDLDVFTFGRQPVAIDIMTAIKGASFQQVYDRSKEFNVDEIKVRTIHINHLIDLKKASGRHKDLDDIENLEKLLLIN